MMDVPTIQPSDTLGTNGTDAFLLLPEIAQFSSARYGCLHPKSVSGFEILLPLWVIGIGRTLNQAMPNDGNLTSFGQVDSPLLCLGSWSGRV
jgi:hypothetical protein